MIKSKVHFKINKYLFVLFHYKLGSTTSAQIPRMLLHIIDHKFNSL